jgi:uncharacterized OB-fold protein
MSEPKTERLLPQATPETAHFWQGTRAGELRLQRCRACDKAYVPPQRFCPSCLSDEVEVFAASGRGHLYGFNISHVNAPGLPAPYVLGVVELEEGPRLMTNIVGCPPTPEAVTLDMPLQVVFAPQSDDVTLPLFKPATEVSQ